MRPVTLIMVAGGENRAEYSLLCCERMPQSYLTDLYALYAGRESQGAAAAGRVPSVVTLRVDEISEPSLWLDCIKWSRYRRQGEERRSLEVFVGRPTGSQLYYAVGPKGDVLVGGPNESIGIHESTVRILCGESKTGCPNPKAFWVDWKRSDPACDEKDERE